MVCVNHQQKEAIGTCVGCGKFICEECQTEIDGKNYCKKCVDDLVKEKTKQIDNLEKKEITAPVPITVSASAEASAKSEKSGGCLSWIIGIILFLIFGGTLAERFWEGFWGAF